MKANVDKKKCIDCKEEVRCRDSYTSWIFFAIGIVATVAVRLVIVLMHWEPIYGKIAWYIGIGGFLIFFIYKFRIYYSRSKVIRIRKLTNKIQEQELTREEKDIISEILCSLSSKKESINYLVIFVLSAVALMVAIYFDFFKAGN